jgi:hypothetical protein
MVNMSVDVMDENVVGEARPEGADFGMDLPNGHKVWFRDFQRGQRLMLVRANDIAAADRQRIEAGPGSTEEKYDALTALSLKADKRMWDAIDSRVIDPRDIELIMDAMISGEIDIEWAWKVFSGGRETPAVVDDDIDEVQQAKPSRRANAKRTQIR